MKRGQWLLTAAVWAALGVCGAHSAAPVALETLIKSIGSALDQNYIYPDKARAMADYLESQRKKGLYDSITDPRLLADKLEDDIQSVQKDGHLHIQYRAPDDAKPGQGGPRPPTRPNREEMQRRLRTENFFLKKVTVLDGNIGYLQLDLFVNDVEDAKPTLTSALRFLSNTDALIIDLRRNGGGSPEMVKQICSYFFGERARLNDFYDRKTDRTTETWTDPTSTGNLHLSMPLYILTSRRSFSGAEDFSYALQASKRAVTVGEATGGGAHPNDEVDVGQGFVASIPYARPINYLTHGDWEGVGVLPDIPVVAEEALEKARRVILEQRLAAAKTEMEKAEIGWSLKVVKVDEYRGPADAAALRKFVGSYGKFAIAVKNGRLYLEMHGRSGLLKPIAANSFLTDDYLENWLQVDLIATAQGKPAVKITPRPGVEEMYRRLFGNGFIYTKT